jgi:hypothetical protein
MGRCTKRDRKTDRQCRRAFHLTGAHVYAEIPKLGAKRARELVDERVFREEVAARADGWCEATGLVRPNGGWVCWDREHLGEHAHHLFPEDRDAGRHYAERGLYLCPTAHAFAHQHPEAAKVLGLLRPDRSDAS